MDIVRLYRDFGVEHLTEGHKHCRPGWVQTECPYCTGNAGYHLGWNVQEEFYSCWRCGWHPPVKTISLLVHITEQEVKTILPAYGINRTFISVKNKDKKDFTFPTNAEELSPTHASYLKKRGFNPDEIQKTWQVTGTGPLSKLDNIDYRFRIIIPFYWNGQVVSFDSRDITGKQVNKYQACPIEYETVEHKKILYGKQEEWSDIGIIVEGPTDVWRFGTSAAATSGIKYTNAQVKVIANTFRHAAVVFDDDPQAQIQAKKLVAELKFRGVTAENVKIKGDPGSMTQKEADKFVKSILL